VSGKRFDVKVTGPAFAGAPTVAAPAAAALPAADAARAFGRIAWVAVAGTPLESPLQGTILKIAVEPGQSVEAGALICVIEAMKMENEIAAHKAGTVVEIPIAVGAAVANGDKLAVITAPAAAE